MKIKVYTYLAVVPMLLGPTASAKQSTPSATITDPAGITLIPYTSEDFRIIGLVIEGWVEVKQGSFPVKVRYQTAPDTDEEAK